MRRKLYGWHLTHTKVLAVEFCSKPLEHRDANWNGLLNAAIREAKARAKSAGELKQLIIVPFVDGQKTDEGYRFLSDIGISIQGQDSNGSWKGARHIAQKLGLQLSVTGLQQRIGESRVDLMTYGRTPWS